MKFLKWFGINGEERCPKCKFSIWDCICRDILGGFQK